MSEEQTVKRVEGILKFLESKNDKLQPVELWCLNELPNRNKWAYQNIRGHMDEFRDIPILTAYLMDGAIISDGHNFQIKRDPKTGKEYASFTAADAERIVGWIDKDASVSIRKDENGIDWIVCKGNLWSFYCYELVQKLKGQGLDGMSVSIETLVYSEDIVDGIAYEKDYSVLGVTILNESVAPAVESASIRTLSHLSDIRGGMKDIVLKAASYIEDDGENVQEKNSLNERMSKLTYFSKKQCAELSKRFDGYTVLAAAQDENGIHVALLSKTGDTARYDMNSVDETIASEKIIACNGSVRFDCDTNCDNAMTVGVDAVIECMSEVVSEAQENCRNAQAAEQKANEALNTAMATIAEMRNAENARRVQSAKACAINTLNAFNANSEFEIPRTALDAINADIDNGVYTERCNAEGKWIGEEEVALRVKALCTDKTIEANNAKAANSKKVYSWERLNNGLEDDGSVAALLKRKGIE